MNWSELISVSIDGGSITVKIGPIAWIIVLILAVVGMVVWFKKGARWWWGYEVVEAELPIANLGKVKIRPTRETVSIAYQAWVEINTRKTGLSFDEEHDVIVEVYNSWYSLFKELRALAKSIPAHRLRHCADTNELIRVMMLVMNEGLRPHLTEWQAKYRRWFKEEAAKDRAAPPQEIQRKYAEYDKLVADLRRVNEGIVRYADWLHRIVVGEVKAGAKT